MLPTVPLIIFPKITLLVDCSKSSLCLAKMNLEVYAWFQTKTLVTSFLYLMDVGKCWLSAIGMSGALNVRAESIT